LLDKGEGERCSRLHKRLIKLGRVLLMLSPTFMLITQLGGEMAPASPLSEIIHKPTENLWSGLLTRNPESTIQKDYVGSMVLFARQLRRLGVKRQLVWPLVSKSSSLLTAITKPSV
jgi:hypothetical protein